jgi:MFS transporter, OFA family, oxalate/formate antiporter
MFLLQSAVLPLVGGVDSMAGLAGLGMLVLLCYGGGFGAMAAFAAEYFGSRHVGLIYGLLMTACGAGASPAHC